MPELPEVETVRRSLAGKVTGETIAEVQVLSQRAIRPLAPEVFASQLVGKTIVELGRRGKYLEFHLSDETTLIIHLRMTGRLILAGPAAPYDKHTAVVLTFESGRQLRFVDQRKFGVMEVVQDPGEASEGYLMLGVEPLDPGFTVDYLAKVLHGRTGKIKSLLLDQRLIAGLGNIYADEALFRAGIHPQRSAGSLSDTEVLRLHRAVREVISEGIRYRGTTIRDYVDGYGTAGSFQERLQVYGREGEPCPNCGAALLRVKVAGRSSFHCPNCQR